MENRTVATFGSVDLEKFISGLHEYLAGELKPVVARLEQAEGKSDTALAGRIAELERELAELKAQAALNHPLEYRGVYSSGGIYGKNDLCTFDGSLWIASTTTTSPPPGNGWKLCVKRGKDGKSARYDR